MLGKIKVWLFWRDVRRRIRERGWTIIHLGDGRSGPVWGYSVGLWEAIGAPELIVFGHDEVWTNGLIFQAQKQIQEGSLSLTDLLPWSLEGFEGVWRRVHPVQIEDAEWFNCARRYKREKMGVEAFDAFQLFVPDEGGKYPWDAGFDEAWRHYQAELYRPEVQHGPHVQRLAAEAGL
jgi:hypothetical protein